MAGASDEVVPSASEEAVFAKEVAITASAPAEPLAQQVVDGTGKEATKTTDETAAEPSSVEPLALQVVVDRKSVV